MLREMKSVKDYIKSLNRKSPELERNKNGLNQIYPIYIRYSMIWKYESNVRNGCKISET